MVVFVGMVYGEYGERNCLFARIRGIYVNTVDKWIYVLNLLLSHYVFLVFVVGHVTNSLVYFSHTWLDALFAKRKKKEKEIAALSSERVFPLLSLI